MDEYEDNYLGFKIIGERLPNAGDSTIWLFVVYDENDQGIFRVKLEVSRTALKGLVSDYKDEHEYFWEEGLRIVHGRITLSKYKQDTEYKHIYGKGVEPPLIIQEPAFNSEDEKIKFYLLESLARIRRRLLPNRFKSAWVDIDSLCQLLRVSEITMKATIGLLYERGFIGGMQVPSSKRYGDSDFKAIYITSGGIEEFDRLGIEIQDRLENAMPDLYEDSVFVLQCMYEKGATSTAKDIKINDLLVLSGLRKEKFDEVIIYLDQADFLDGTWGNGGTRWMTPKGIDRFTQEKNKRIPLSFNAVRIARLLGEKNLNAHRKVFQIRQF